MAEQWESKPGIHAVNGIKYAEVVLISGTSTRKHAVIGFEAEGAYHKFAISIEDAEAILEILPKCLAGMKSFDIQSN